MALVDESLQARMRAIPAVQRVYREMGWERPTVWQSEAVRRTLGEVREAVRQGEEVPEWLALRQQIGFLAENLAKPSLQPLLNATGVVIHTNLGRSPLPYEVMESVHAVATGYSTLEYRLSSGGRGSRHDHVSELIGWLCGGEAAMVVNNNAAAVLLALSQLASNQEVIVSRGQLVEIGGSFRIPDVMALSGARLVEVGSTNKTHLKDYERAITADTRSLLKVHTSNFRMLGFTESPSTESLAALAHAHQLTMMEDLGSGVIHRFSIDGYTEPSVREVIQAGVDIVTFSGDKLLGGPQAGIIVGNRDLVNAMKKHPLARALRVDKMTLAALEGVVRIYLEGREAELPLWQMLTADVSLLKVRARRLATGIRRRFSSATVEIAIEAETAEVGGGSMPGTRLPTVVVALRPKNYSAAALERELRQASPPVIARIHDDRLILDPRSVLPHQDRLLLHQTIRALEARALPVDM